MSDKKQKKRILWPIDPFEPSDETRDAVTGLLRILGEKYATRIDPVYVFSPDSFNLPMEFSPPWSKRYAPETRKAMGAALKDVVLPGLSKPETLLQKRPSIRASVQRLLTHAKTTDAELIVTGTHARHGLERFILGSFTETLLLESKIPVLIVHPDWKPAPIRKILFPTDFGQGSRALYSRVLKIAKTWGAELTLFHAILRPVEPVFQSGVYLLGGGWIPMTDYSNEAEHQAREKLMQWQKEGQKLGISVKVELDTSTGSVTRAILDRAKIEESSMICLQAKSGATKSAILGSISRQVAREASCLVWVLHD